MIYIFDAGNRETHGQYLREMHRQRHDIFVGTLGWYQLESLFGLEIDQYDTRLATHLVSVSDQGDVMGGVRVMPTTFGTFLGEHYRDQMFDPGYAFGPKVWEMYRLFVSDSDWTSKGGHPVRREVMLSLYEFLLQRGAEKVIAVSDVKAFEKLPPFWQAKEIGRRSTFQIRGGADGECALVEIPIKAEILDVTKKVLGYEGCQLARAEAVLDPAPVKVLPEEIYAVNRWLSYQPEKIHEARQMLKHADADAEACQAFKHLVGRAVKHAMTKGKDKAVTEGRVH